jgi:serine/threonine protein phosphatase PrpC
VKYSSNELGELLVNKAIERGSMDNISCIVIRLF